MKIHIYQLFTRLFGNKNDFNKPNGTIVENGCGKFNDINDQAMQAIKALGMTHIWYTGVLEHASLSAYPEANIKADHPDFVKGNAGSPYAIRDYYDVSPDLAKDPIQRMVEFRELLQRTHKNGLKAIIDFVPNHVSRAYKSDNKPKGIPDLGETDDASLAFYMHNNFYYLPGETLHLPKKSNTPYVENPAKVTGNDCFSAYPSINDWYETVKLNYGIDYQNGHAKHFSPIPNTWLKMTDILLFWAENGVDGFRCDMAEMVPVEFWRYAIQQVKTKYPGILFIAEVYDPNQYRSYIHEGGFDLLYDKVGLYDTLKGIIEGHKWANDITSCWQAIEDIKPYMLNFLENHDEQRIASHYFATNPWRGIPMLAVSCGMEKSSYMQYFAQELGEDAGDAEGFSGLDGRTTIFDYWGIKSQQAWMNGGLFNDAKLSTSQKELRQAYQDILNLVLKEKTMQIGGFYDLQWANRDNHAYNNQFIYSYLRHTKDAIILCVVNLDTHPQEVRVLIPQHAKELTAYNDALEGIILYDNNGISRTIKGDLSFNMRASGVLFIKFNL